MGLLQWENRYSVGIEAVDHEHRELVDLINRLHDKATVQGSKVAVLGFFGDLFKAISAHFALEERAMREARYSELGAHKQDHERLLDDLRDIMDSDAGSEADARSEALGSALDAWFSVHFATFDARLHAMPTARR